MGAQNGHFRAHASESVPYAIERYSAETARLFRVLDRRLQGRDFIAGSYSIADIACYPWVVPHASFGIALADHPDLQRWFERIAARLQVREGCLRAQQRAAVRRSAQGAVRQHRGLTDRAPTARRGRPYDQA